MAGDFVAEVKGMPDLARSLRALPQNIAKNVLRGAAGAGAAVVRADAKARAPVWTGPVAEGHPPRGTLKRAVYQFQIREASTVLRQVFGVSVRQAFNGRSGKGSRSIKAYGNRDAYYWKFVEFGTAKMAARPFLRPAFETKKQEIVRAMREYMAQRIPKEIERARRRRS